MTDGLPPQVGPYEPIELLAVGGMARVVVARRPTDGERVALKLILPELAEDDEYVTMFRDEALINARVSHPNVVQVYDVGRDPRTHILYMALELVLGATFSRLVRAHRSVGVPWPVAAFALAQAAEGLAAAHEATSDDGRSLEIVHRDVSPQNLMVNLDGHVRVGDFGVARAARRATRTKTGQFKGKLSYCSPEHALGRTVDGRADVFSLGIVTFEALTGVRLFARPTPFATLEAILHKPIPSVSELQKDLPDELVALVDQMLTRELEERPATAREVAERIRALIEDEEQARRDLVDAVSRAASAKVLRLAGRKVVATESGTHLTEEAVTRVEGPEEDATVVEDREPGA